MEIASPLLLRAFSQDIKPVKETMMQGKLAVIQGPIWLLQVFSTYLLSNIYRQRRDYKDGELKGEAKGDYFPPFIIATDEAHNFAPKAEIRQQRELSPKYLKKVGNMGYFWCWQLSGLHYLMKQLPPN